MKHTEFTANASTRAKEISKERGGVYITYEDVYQAAEETHNAFTRLTALNAILDRNPLPQTKPVTEQCRDCVFFVGPIEHGYAVCERYPQPIAKTVTQWCGEWKARE